MENLLRNALDHGGDDVTISLRALDTGFYLEDDGPGIPESIRDDVFSSGFTTTREGTGYGLSIVNDVVEDHGWAIQIKEGSEGGARFEITGVEPAQLDSWSGGCGGFPGKWSAVKYVRLAWSIQYGHSARLDASDPVRYLASQ